MIDLALLLDLYGNSEETKLLICTAIFVWGLQRHRNGGLNSGQKSAIIVIDAFGTFIQVLRTFRGGFRTSKVFLIKLIEIVILWVYYTIPFGFSLQLVWTLFGHQFSTF